MSQVIDAAALISKELESAVLLVHHCGWDAAHARGSSVQLGNVDTMARVDRKKDTFFATLTVEKQKDGAKRKFCFLAHEVRLGTYDRYGDEQTSLCATEVTPDETAEG